MPYPSDIDNLTAADFGGDATKLSAAKKELKNRIINFVKYHIQDNSVIIGGEEQNNTKFESFTNNLSTKRYYNLTVTSDANNLTVTDHTNHSYKVVKTDGLYNLQGREYWITNKDKTNDQIYNASDVVVHQINGALIYSNDQLTSWKNAIGLSTSTQAKKRRR